MSKDERKCVWSRIWTSDLLSEVVCTTNHKLFIPFVGCCLLYFLLMMVVFVFQYFCEDFRVMNYLCVGPPQSIDHWMRNGCMSTLLCGISSYRLCIILKHLRQFLQSDWFLHIDIWHNIDTSVGVADLRLCSKNNFHSHLVAYFWNNDLQRIWFVWPDTYWSCPYLYQTVQTRHALTIQLLIV